MPNPTIPNQAPRDLQLIAQMVVENPTVAKQMLRSKVFSSHRRAVQSKEALASYAAGVGKKLVSFGFGQIPVPAVGSVLDKAWGFATDKARELHLAKHTGMNAPLSEKVKFSLKAIGGDMTSLDRFRWKISHAIEQCNKAETAQGGAACDQVVRLWAKRKYLDHRVAKLKGKLATMQGVISATEEWLDTVAPGGEMKTEQELKQDVSIHLANLKNADHSECKDVYCIYGKADWTGQRSVPTSDLAKQFIRATGEVSAYALSDPTSELLNRL